MAYKHGKLSALRNPEGLWINTQPFREAAIHFTKHGYYCKEPWGTPGWLEYWQEQRKRCISGYSVGGAKITGYHYFYLNFCPILKVSDTSSKVSSKIEGFPDFWDGDYNFFWVREIARYGVFDSVNENSKTAELFFSWDELTQAAELKKLFESLYLEVKIEVDHMRGGYNLIVGKSRRKGFSYKAASIGACNYYTKPKTLTIYGAYEKKYLYPKGLFTMSRNYLNFINDNTGWSMPSDVIDKQDHVKGSYIEYVRGIKTERGFKSEIMAATFKDNPDAIRGKDAEDLFFEEAGAFGTPGLLQQSIAASQPCVRAGSITTGMMTVFGTSGDMEGGTYDYADMHSRPLAFGFLPFNNIWDEGLSDTMCGYFHPVNINMEGYYDEQGNSDIKGAKGQEIRVRDTMKANGATSIQLQQRQQENPLSPGEAFAGTTANIFPVAELKRQLLKVRARGLQRSKGTPVILKRKEGNEIEAIRNHNLSPITSFVSVPKDTKGAVMIYEAPISNPPSGLYKIGYDPVRQDQGTSLAGVIVYKGVLKGSPTYNCIVAEYVGRTSDPEDIDKIAELLADYYSAKVMYENEVTATKNYFRRIKRLGILAVQPDLVISKNVKNSTVARVYGCHMTPSLKDAGERYISTWLQTVLDYDENGEAITVIDKIYSIRLLEELINYNRKGNFDLVSALIMVMIQAQEEDLGKEYENEPKHTVAQQLLEQLQNKARHAAYQ